MAVKDHLHETFFETEEKVGRANGDWVACHEFC